MNKFAKITLPFWLPLSCLALLFANFASPVPGSSHLFLLEKSGQSEAGFPGSVLSADYTQMVYFSKIVPETTAKVQAEKKVFSVLFQKDGKLTPENGIYLAVSKSIIPGFSTRKILFPFHYFL